MAIGYAHTLYCDRPGCRATQMVKDTRSAAHARQLAHDQLGWGSDSDGDWCPTDETARAMTRATDTEGPSQ